MRAMGGPVTKPTEFGGAAGVPEQAAPYGDEEDHGGSREDPETLGKVENEAPAELGDSAGVADEGWRAGDRTRTGDVQLGKLAFYH